MTIGTQIGFAIGGFAPVVAAAVQGEGPNAWVPVAPLNSPIGVVASIAAWTARETHKGSEVCRKYGFRPARAGIVVS
jgi:hypothetical protein